MKKQAILFGTLFSFFFLATACGPDTTEQDMEMAAMRAVMAQGGPGAGGGSNTTVTQTATVTRTATTTATSTSTSTSSN